ncbi:aspartate carbamoyltransferase [Clostridiaceae bacterium OttesenSCG-928-D20]|nr:aspartate carbamoyltransferase [Clostridiaceae bacterium OttesenSCG-928-D20]
MRHLIDIVDFSTKEIDDMIRLAIDIIDHGDDYADVCKRKTLATLFYEPSTRTRLSFEAAMLELGGNILGFSEATSSSAAKGESVADTIRTVACYADIITMRHHKEGAPLMAALNSPVPIINAGDGGHSHPTQTLTDLLTIHREKGQFENLTVGLCGDLKFGRTVHSLITALSEYSGVKFVLISPEELRVPGYIYDGVLTKTGHEWLETDRLSDVLPELDVLYMTRVQKERFFNEADYIRLKDSFILDAEGMKRAKKDLSILHPLPRVNEISVKIDSDPRAAYFRQAKYGKFVRMALIMTLLEVTK